MEENNNEVVYKLRKRWLLFGLPFTFTVYYIKEDVITIDAGFFKTTEDDCYMYKVQDVKLERSLLQRMAGLGTVVCFTGDTTNPQLLIQNIKNSKEVKDYILKQSEVARIKRRTINMVDIGAGVAGDLDGDGFIDQMN
ncbi:MAG: PH domain-containing protein [Lachnospiraceae bacterium]|nr:PH domain-containing protein [Lachnospiraceae bacterium]